MNINYYYRNSQAGFSIRAVFQTIVNEIGKNNTITETYLPSPHAHVKDIILNGIYAKKQQKNNYLNHITGEVHYLLYFLNPQKTIVTVHDIMYYSYLKGIKKKLWKILYINPLKRAAHITFISEFAKSQVLKEISLPTEKISVIPNPVDNSFTYTHKVFNASKPRILHIGTLERKNLVRTIQALKGISCHLRIIGKINDEITALLKQCEIEYSNSWNLTHEQIVQEYQQADIINFPSLYEGFGMPIIEGQASGRIVVTSNISPMKEIANDGAILVNPMDKNSLHEAYISIIKNKNLRESIIQKGLVNVQKYTDKTIQNQYLEIYKTAYENIY